MLKIHRNLTRPQSSSLLLCATLRRLGTSQHRNIELARAVDAMMARATRIYILMIKVKQVVFFSSSQNFLKEIETLVEVWENSKKL